MRKKVILTTLVAFVLLAAAIAAGLAAVFTVTGIRTEFHVFSEEGMEESAALSERLERFVGKNITFLDLSDVAEEVEAYPCLRVESVKKRYPQRIELVVSERREAFAIRKTDGTWQIFDEEGRYLYDKAENVNRAGGENLELSGFVVTVHEDGTMGGTYTQEALAVYRAFAAKLEEVRANVISMSIVRYGSEGNSRNHTLRIAMREGCVIDLINPSTLAAEKAEAAIGAYLALEDGQRLSGTITVADDFATGELLPPDYRA